MFAIISADIVSSTSLSVAETIELKQKIEKLFGTLENRYPDFWGRQIKGDYIECVFRDVSNVFRAALIIKTYIKSFPVAGNKEIKDFQTYGVRMAVGIGDMRIMDIGQGILDGEAIYLSGRALENMGPLNKGVFTIQIAKKQLSESLHIIAILTDVILNNMTSRQSEVVYYKLLGLKETEIAKELGISQASVNKASSSAKWYCIEEALRYFENIKFEEYE